MCCFNKPAIRVPVSLLLFAYGLLKTLGNAVSSGSNKEEERGPSGVVRNGGNHTKIWHLLPLPLLQIHSYHTLSLSLSLHPQPLILPFSTSSFPHPSLHPTPSPHLSLPSIPHPLTFLLVLHWWAPDPTWLALCLGRNLLVILERPGPSTALLCWSRGGVGLGALAVTRLLLLLGREGVCGSSRLAFGLERNRKETDSLLQHKEIDRWTGSLLHFSLQGVD